MLEPLVLIDLDPQAGLFDPAIANQANRALSEVAAVLRSRDVEIAWISGQPNDMEGPIRDRLALAALDPRSEDQVLLTDPEFATKQSLRTRLSEEFCIVAIAGDAREDFDELYGYLKDPDAALPLDEMYGAGWFLTPPPIE